MGATTEKASAPVGEAAPAPVGEATPGQVLAAIDDGKATIRMVKTDDAGKPVRGDHGGLVIEPRRLKAEHILSYRVVGETVSAVLVDGRKVTGTLKGRGK